MGCRNSRPVERQIFLTKTQRTASLGKRVVTTVVGEKEFERALSAKVSGPGSLQLVRKLVRNDTLQLSFSAHELSQLIDRFRAEMDNPRQETMSKETFLRIVNISAGAHSGALMSQLFRQFDRDGDGVLTLREFLEGFSYWKAQVRPLITHHE